MSNMTLTLGGASLAVAVVGRALVKKDDKAPLGLVLFVDDCAVARICGISEIHEEGGKLFYILRCIKHTMVNGQPTNFTLCNYGPTDDLVPENATTWNGKAALKHVKLPEDIGSFGPEQLTYLLDAGQVMNRMGYRKAPVAKRVRRVCGR